MSGRGTRAMPAVLLCMAAQRPVPAVLPCTGVRNQRRRFCHARRVLVRLGYRPVALPLCPSARPRNKDVGFPAAGEPAGVFSASPVPALRAKSETAPAPPKTGGQGLLKIHKTGFSGQRRPAPAERRSCQNHCLPCNGRRPNGPSGSWGGKLPGFWARPVPLWKR